MISILTFLSVGFLVVAIYYNVQYQRGQWIFRRRMSTYDKEQAQVERTKVDNFYKALGIAG
jgi:hypothetical protein